MIRVKNSKVTLKNRKKYLKLAKGYTGSNSRLFTLAFEQVKQGLNSQYKSRRLKKRNYRRLWIHRINAVSKLNNINYSKFIGLLRKSNILLNRKILAFIAFSDIEIFNLIFRIIK